MYCVTAVEASPVVTSRIRYWEIFTEIAGAHVYWQKGQHGYADQIKAGGLVKKFYAYLGSRFLSGGKDIFRQYFFSGSI
ncbi:hypothetical protein ACI65C_010160 [Semiaphis heraclei]